MEVKMTTSSTTNIDHELKSFCRKQSMYLGVDEIYTTDCLNQLALFPRNPFGSYQIQKFTAIPKYKYKSQYTLKPCSILHSQTHK
jgi:hypothetical protein